MARRNLNDLLAFVTVAREGSFTRAAKVLGITQSALSQTIKALEARLDIRLLTRTTRSLSLTPAGERLVNAIGHRIDEIEDELAALTALRDKPAGTVRITCADHVLRANLWPKLVPVLREYPEIEIEFDVSYGLRDIVADRFDAGVRLGEQVDKDMIAVPIGPKMRMAAAASPDYFARHGKPKQPSDLTAHRCIAQRQVSGGLYAWEFDRRGRELEVRVEGQVIMNTSPHIVAAALDGMGIAFLPEDEFSPHLEQGRLVRVLEEWCPPFAGFHLYYPSRRHPSPAFSLVLDALRYRT
ncbi:LysR family transcriptional regulator [Luteimonas sp. Sa2BVA3]|uniref:LysR family transcriptional regulator n=1 Tax=Luteimonas colneyensis TaxID=2762230 RepID=A0ABR8UHV3_9GAMM|nr:LysR family transcriptional regulator [Luteimonas colneyensis]MBD7987596.1 LysR family transcriptional regulator [Luteimonas colneyensis]